MCLVHVLVIGHDESVALTDEPRPCIDDVVEILVEESGQRDLIGIVAVIFAEKGVLPCLVIGKKDAASLGAALFADICDDLIHRLLEVIGLAQHKAGLDDVGCRLGRYVRKLVQIGLRVHLV